MSFLADYFSRSSTNGHMTGNHFHHGDPNKGYELSAKLRIQVKYLKSQWCNIPQKIIVSIFHSF